MTDWGPPMPLRLPDGTRLLHIGPPKTGTTNLQESARTARPELARHGVYYPGDTRNHRAEILSVLGEPDPMLLRVAGRDLPPGSLRADADRVTPRSRWEALLDDLAATDAKRSLISHEYASMASDDEAAQFVQGLGRDRVHVVITLRPHWVVLTSQWIEELKVALTDSFDQWLERFYDASDATFPVRMRRYLDQGALVDRWVRAAGPERVTVVVVDKANMNLLTETFEQLLGLPDNTLSGVVTDGRRINRSMSLPEARVFREVNEQIFDPETLSWPVYLRVVRTGAVDRVLMAREPGAGEPRVTMPPWAAQRAGQLGVQFAARIEQSGARIIGDLDVLRSGPPGPDTSTPQEVDASIYESIAVASLTGSVEGATGYERSLARRMASARTRAANAKRDLERVEQTLTVVRRDLERVERSLQRERAAHSRTKQVVASLKRRTIRQQVKALPAAERAQRAAASFSTHDLAGALRIRLMHKARTRRSMRLR